MKFLILVFIFSIFLKFNAFSQIDTLAISLKNGQTEKISISQIEKIQFENITVVDEKRNVLSNLNIKGNYPNPFQRQTSIEFEIAESGNVVLLIYDNNGNQIQKLECLNCHEGKNILQWNCIDKNNNMVQSGVYFYEVQFNNDVKSKKMILIK